MKRTLIRKNGSRRRRRNGAAVVEFAVVLPLLMVLLMGIIEFGWVFMVRQTLTNAAREGCRVAVLKTATADDVASRIRDVMQPLGFAEGTDWSFNSSDLEAEVQLINVSIPIDRVSLTGSFILEGGYDLTGTCSMRKEGVVAVN